MDFSKYQNAVDESVARVNSRSTSVSRNARIDKPVPQIRKFSRWNKKDHEEASAIVNERLDRIEKGWLGGEFVKGGTAQTLAMARKYPIAFLEILSAIRDMPARCESIQKGFDVVPSPIAGPQAYDLQTPAMMLYPVMSPIRNMLPRLGGTGEAHNWAAILAVDDNNVGIGLGTGQRGAIINQRFARFSAPFRSIGLENQVTFEAQSSAIGFQDILSLATLQTMQALMIREEQAIIAGIGSPLEINGTSYALGTTPTPTLVTSTTGGALAATTAHYVVAVALSLEGTTRVLNPAGFGSFTSGGTSALSAGTTQIVRTNADGTTTTFNAGFSQRSAQATITTGAGATNSITASVTAQVNAFGYIWGISTASGGPYNVFGASNVNTIVLTNLGTGNCTVPVDLATNDRSANSFIFDGLWTQALGTLSAFVNPTSLTTTPYFTGSTSMINQTAPYFLANYMTLNGAVLASNGNVGCSQFDQMLQFMFDVYRFSPHKIFVHSDIQSQLSNLVLSGPSAGASIIRLTGDTQDKDGKATLSANRVVTNYNNPFTNEMIEIMVHPYLTPGIALFYTEHLPYPLTNAGVLAAVRAKRDYYAQEWPLRSRAYQYGVYSEQMVECVFPPGFQCIANIGSVAGNPSFAPSVTMPTQNLPTAFI
jgi:hypothetical protein